MRLIKNKRRRDPRYFLHEQQELTEGLTLSPKEYARRAANLGQPTELYEYGTLLGGLAGIYDGLVQHSQGRRDYGLPPAVIDELRGSISAEAIRAISDTLALEEETADNLGDAQKLRSASRLVPVGRDPLSQLLSSPLAQEKMSEHPVRDEEDDDL